VNIQNSSAILAIVVKPQPLECYFGGFLLHQGGVMKQIAVFLFVLFMPLVAMGQGGLVNSVEDLSEQTKMQYAQLLEQVRVVEPYFASMIDAMNISEIAKIAKIRSYFAQKTFDSYKEYMKELFCEKHKESVRLYQAQSRRLCLSFDKEGQLCRCPREYPASRLHLSEGSFRWQERQRRRALRLFTSISVSQISRRQ